MIFIRTGTGRIMVEIECWQCGKKYESDCDIPSLCEDCIENMMKLAEHTKAVTKDGIEWQ